MPDTKPEDCDPIVFYAPSDIFGGTKPVPSCLPPTKRVPDALIETTPQRLVAVRRPMPPSVRIGNLEATAFCSDGSKGPSVTTESWTLTGAVAFSLVPSLEDSVLEYIVQNNLVGVLEAALASEETQPSVEDVARLTGMTSAQATTLLDAWLSLRATLTESALALAQSQLYCVWGNTVQVAECEDPAMAKYDEHPDAVFSYIVPAWFVTSEVSQNDADSQALLMAQRQLNCFYTSDYTLVDCTTRPDRPQAIMEPVPTDLTPVYPGKPLRVGEFAVRGGLFTSTISKEDANSQASTFGYAQLVCFYINAALSLQCEDPTARDAGVSPDEEIAHEANLTESKPGQWVTIPMGYIRSDMSAQEADSQARDMADSLLECCFLSKAIHVECPPFELLKPDGTPALDRYGNPIFIPASQTESPVWSWDVVAGAYSSCNSQAEADDYASNGVVEMLECYYCNTVALPTCVPEWVILAVVDGIKLEDGTLYKLTLPIDPKTLINPFTGEPEDLTGWSIDATTGTPADVFCSPEFIQSQQVADDAGQTKVETLKDTRGECQFANDLVIAACQAYDPYDSDNLQLDHTGVTPSGEAYRFVTKSTPCNQPGVCCYSEELSSPIPGEYVEVVAESIVATALDVPGTLPDTDPNYSRDYNDRLTKQYVNQQAYSLAMSLLYCVYANPVAIGQCEITTSPLRSEICTNGNADSWKFGRSMSAKGLAPSSHQASNPFLISKGMFTSPISMDAVYGDVEQFILSNLICSYCNEPQTATCPPGLTSLNKAEIPACMILADTLELANALAKAMAASLLACITSQTPIPGPAGRDGTNGTDGENGAPGKDGQCTGGQCSGECFGVYS